MKLIVSKYIPFHGYVAMTFFNIIIWRKEYISKLADDKYYTTVYNHECIHEAQMKDLCPLILIGGILFYTIYLLEWFIKVLFVYPFSNKAYRNISFEKEAYENEKDLNYVKCRKKFSWLSRIFK